MRQYVSNKSFGDDGLLEIIGKDFRYLRNVLRMRAGDMVSVRLPDGSFSNSTVCVVDDRAKKIVLQICADTEFGQSGGENQSDYSARTEIWLFMFVPKAQKAELIVRQAAECGVSRIIPVQSDYSAAGAGKINFNSERFERIIKEARQQSGSPVSTELGCCVPLEKAVELWKERVQGNEGNCFSCVMYERNEKSRTMKKAFEGRKEPFDAACIACGSEGGISPGEIDFLEKSGFSVIHFDTNILRCETASLYGIAVLQSELSGLGRE